MIYELLFNFFHNLFDARSATNSITLFGFGDTIKYYLLYVTEHR